MDSLAVIADVDLVVVGGSSAAVAAALAASKCGLSVFLAAPRPYLGEDICAHERFWLEPDDAPACALAKALFPKDADQPPTPLAVKRHLEQSLVQAGIPFLLDSPAVGLLVDAHQETAGVVIGNRGGMQAIRATLIIDGTDRALLARQTQAGFRPFVPGPRTFERTLVGPPVLNLGGISARPLNPPWRWKTSDQEKLLPATSYAFTYPMTAPTPDAYAAVQSYAREVIWHPSQLFSSECLWNIPSDTLISTERLNTWPGAASFDLRCLRATGRVWILSGNGDMPPEAARRMLAPATFMTVGERLGIQLADVLKWASKPRQPLRMLAVAQTPLADAEVRTRSALLRNPDAPRVEADLNRLPVIGRTAVLVVGGGTAGAPAAIASARTGADTLVLEHLPALGGVSTAGMIGCYYHGNRVGFTAEIDTALAAFGKDSGFAAKSGHTNIEWRMAWYHNELRKAGGRVWYGYRVCGAVVRQGTVTGVVACGPEGMGLVLADRVIDSTGGSDVAGFAGAQVRVTTGEHIAVQGTGLSPRNPGVSYDNSDNTFVDDTDPVDVTAQFVAMRLRYPTAFDVAQIVDSRERQQIVGDITLSPVDFLCGRTYPDSITLARSNFDSHGFTVHPVFAVKPPDHASLDAYVSWRCLLPAGLENIAVTGLGLSCHRDALPVVRMQPDVQNQGYAVGYAAALSCADGTTLRKVDIRKVQVHLVAKGILQTEVLIHRDSFPLGAAEIQAAVTGDLDSYRNMAILFAHPSEARAPLRDTYSAEQDPKRRLRLAQILGLMGDATGADLLVRTIADAPWDEAWNYRGMGQFGRSQSALDDLITSASLTQCAALLPVLAKKAEELPDDPGFSHCKALATAFARLAGIDSRKLGAKALAGILARPGVTGFAACTQADLQKQVTLEQNETVARNRALRELSLAVGLWRCGDSKGLGAGILHAYARDLRGHFARHAVGVCRA